MPNIIELTRRGRRALIQSQAYFLHFEGDNEFARRPWIGQTLYAREIAMADRAIPARFARSDEEHIQLCLDIAPAIIRALRDAASKINFLSTQKGLSDLANQISELADLPIVPYQPHLENIDFSRTRDRDELITSVMARSAGVPLPPEPAVDDSPGF